MAFTDYREHNKSQVKIDRNRRVSRLKRLLWSPIDTRVGRQQRTAKHKQHNRQPRSGEPQTIPVADETCEVADEDDQSCSGRDHRRGLPSRDRSAYKYEKITRIVEPLAVHGLPRGHVIIADQIQADDDSRDQQPRCDGLLRLSSDEEHERENWPEQQCVRERERRDRHENCRYAELCSSGPVLRTQDNQGRDEAKIWDEHLKLKSPRPVLRLDG